jgi:hypothetical protein
MYMCIYMYLFYSTILKLAANDGDDMDGDVEAAAGNVIRTPAGGVSQHFIKLHMCSVNMHMQVHINIFVFLESNDESCKFLYAFISNRYILSFQKVKRIIFLMFSLLE